MLATGLRDLILKRRSVRLFQDRPVSHSTIAALLADAIWSPSPHNVQPWRFTILGPEARSLLADRMAEQLGRELRADGLSEDSVVRQTSRSRTRISNAPAAILCSLVTNGLVTYPDTRRNALEWQMAVQSVGAVLQSLFLLAHDRGLGTCWMAAPMYCPGLVRETIALPEDYSPQALVLMGYAAQAGKTRPRRPIEEIITER